MFVKVRVDSLHRNRKNRKSKEMQNYGVPENKTGNIKDQAAQRQDQAA